MPRHAPEPGEGALLAAGIALALISVAAAIEGLGEFHPYPTVDLETGLETLAFALAIPVVCLLPLAGGMLSRMSDRAGPRAIGGRT
jgi:hypothetical protein